MPRSSAAGFFTWEVRRRLDECLQPWPFLYSGHPDCHSGWCSSNTFVAAMAAGQGLFSQGLQYRGSHRCSPLGFSLE